MKVIGLRKEIDVNILIQVLKKHLPEKDKNYIKEKAESISNGYYVDLEEDWALEQDLKDLGVSIK